MKNAMIHWNGNQMCVIDTETTGLEAGWHEIIQICILPLDSNIKPRKNVLPFYIEMIPEHPERASPEAMRVNKLNFAQIAQRGHDREKAKDLLDEWIKKLDLPYTSYGNRKRVIPLGQNYAFDQAHIKAWLGDETYDEYFAHRYRDTLQTANYLNDRAGMHAEKVPFSKTKLGWLCNKLDVDNERAHDALSDCIATAEVYRKLLLRGLLG